MTHNPLRSREAVEIGDRKAPTKAQKTAAWNAVNGLCWWCLKPVAPDGLDVHWDHELARGLTGDDSTENLAPLHVRCHHEKTFGKTGDIARVAKAKRQSKLNHPKVRKPGGFSTTLRKKMDGTVERRCVVLGVPLPLNPETGEET